MKNISPNLLTEVRDIMKRDPAHDFEHVMRVCANAKIICKMEGVTDRLVLHAGLLHDLVSYSKLEERSKLSAIESAELAKRILDKHGFTVNEIDIITDAIRCHRFSDGLVAKTVESKILQDADRLDALGAVGIARVFSTGGALERSMYNPDDPFCENREPDDTKWTVDHFFKKLLTLEASMNTKSGKNLAKERSDILWKYLMWLKKEIHP